MGKPYFAQHRTIRVENDAAGSRRAWVEVADGEAIMLKFPAGTSPAEIESKAAAELNRLKQIDALIDQAQSIEEQLAQLGA